MNDPKRSNPSPVGALALVPLWRLFSPSTRGVTISVLLLSILAVAGWWSWQRWGREVVGDQRFQLEPENLQITPPPEWVHADIRDEVLNHAGFRSASLLDRDLTIRLARAFAAHPWVAKVRRVIKSPQGTVQVELDYRMPVAMVEVDNVVYAIDESAVVLPSDYFLAHPDAIRNFPRIQIEGALLSVPAGSAWGDHRIASAARLSAALLRSWPRYGLYRISLLSPVPLHEMTPGLYVLSSKSGARVFWGHAPHQEVAGEPVVGEKIRRLELYVERHGSFADKSPSVEVDLNESALLSLPMPVSRRDEP